MWHCVVGSVVPDTLKDHSYFIDIDIGILFMFHESTITINRI